jgi:hypothetical protein
VVLIVLNYGNIMYEWYNRLDGNEYISFRMTFIESVYAGELVESDCEDEKRIDADEEGKKTSQQPQQQLCEQHPIL